MNQLTHEFKVSGFSKPELDDLQRLMADTLARARFQRKTLESMADIDPEVKKIQLDLWDRSIDLSGKMLKASLDALHPQKSVSEINTDQHGNIEIIWH